MVTNEKDLVQRFELIEMGRIKPNKYKVTGSTSIKGKGGVISAKSTAFVYTLAEIDAAPAPLERKKTFKEFESMPRDEA
jgi:hypothetical protein